MVLLNVPSTNALIDFLFSIKARLRLFFVSSVSSFELVVSYHDEVFVSVFNCCKPFELFTK